MRHHPSGSGITGSPVLDESSVATGLVVVGSSPLLLLDVDASLVLVTGSIVVLLVDVLPVVPVVPTHSPARSGGASSEKRFIDGQSSSGKLQYPGTSHLPSGLPAFTHCASL